MKNNFRNNLRYYLELSKIKIMLPVSLTGFTGYFIFDPHISLNIILISVGILLLAVSSSALNQVQEVNIDRKMNRTKNRPLPAENLSIKQAIIFILLSLILGTTLIYFYGNLTAALIGLFTILWYNGIYTNFKRISAFAVVPGAITGALPPLIGWVAAGGSISDKTIIFLGFLIFTGQIPHFWLLILKYGEEYQKAGIPSLTNILNRNQINRLTFTWVVTSVISALFLCYFEIIVSKPLIIILLIASFCIIWQFKDLIKETEEPVRFRKYFISLNVYFLIVLLLLISDKIINPVIRAY